MKKMKENKAECQPTFGTLPFAQPHKLTLRKSQTAKSCLRT